MITEPTESLHTTATSSATDAPPGARLISLLLGKHVTHAISAVAGLGVADQRSDVPVPMETIAEAVAANVPALYRVMRTLAAVRVFAEDPNRSFSRTAMAQLLRQDAPGSVRYCAISTATPGARGRSKCLQKLCVPGSMV